MKTLRYLFLILLFAVGSANATNYYVNTASSGGDGTTTATSGAQAAFATIAAAQAAITGDQSDNSLLFNRGNTWREQFTVGANGTAGHPFTVGAYGTGALPKIYGSTQLSTWTPEDYTPSSTPTRVQSTVSISESDASVTATYISTPTQGNLLVAVGRSGGQLIGNASISGWTLATSAQVVLGSASVGIWYKIAGASESKDVTLAWTSSTQTSLKIEEWANISSSPLDQVAYTNDTGSTVTSRSSGTTGSTTVDNELLIAVVAAGSTFTASSWSNSFTDESISGDWVWASKVVSSTGAQETTMSWTTARKAGGCIATFKASTSSSRTLAKASLAADPVSVWFINTDESIIWGTEKSSKDLLAAEYDWWFDDPNNLLYVFAATDPDTRYTSIETPTRAYGVYSNDKAYITIQNIEAAFCFLSTDARGIHVYTGTNAIIENCVSHHNGDLGDGSSPQGNGINVYGNDNLIIRNNVCYENARRGIVTFNNLGQSCDNVIIERNECYNNYHAQIDVFTGPDGIDGHIIRYNHCYLNSDYGAHGKGKLNTHGIYAQPSVSGATITNMMIHHNIVNHMYSDSLIAVDSDVSGASASGIEIYNNTVYGYLSGSSWAPGINIRAASTTGVIIKNNIGVDCKGGNLVVVENDSIDACDYNLWYQSAGGADIYVDADTTDYHYDDFAAYKAATSFDTNGKWQDPLFVSATDFHLQSASPCIDAGTPIAGIHDQAGNTDYGGNKSPQRTNPSIGAYERIRPVVRGRVMK